MTFLGMLFQGRIKRQERCTEILFILTKDLLFRRDDPCATLIADRLPFIRTAYF